MAQAAISRELLQRYEELHISSICTAVGFVDDAQNHCAHFVNHVLGYDAPFNCGQLFGKPGAAANIRVHETFAACPRVGRFDDHPVGTSFLAFVTQSTAVDLASHTMENIPKKHIGIFCEGEIWHYSNAKRKVVREAPQQFATHFSGNGFVLFFGTFPKEVRALMVPTVATNRLNATGRELRLGQSDDVDVAVWQQFLIVRQLLSGGNIRQLLDGNFGPKTEEATGAFQVSAGLTETGIVNEATARAAVARGFIPRISAPRRKAVTHVTSAMTVAAVDALDRLRLRSVFYTEEVLAVEGAHIIARLEPHKHTEGTQLRFWHQGITLYPFQEDGDTQIAVSEDRNDCAIDAMAKTIVVASEPPIDANFEHLVTELATRLREALEDLAAKGKPFKFVEGFRTADRQQWLYGSGRPNASPYGRTGPIITYKDGVNALSNHQGNGTPGTGRAADCYPVRNGSVYIPAASDPVWETYAGAVNAQGLDAGYYWTSFKDAPHCELRG